MTSAAATAVLTPAEMAIGTPLPTRRQEDWKWTDLRRRIETPYARGAGVADPSRVARLIAADPLAKLPLRRVVFVNGVLDRSHSDLTGLALKDGAPALAEAEWLAAMNTTLEAQPVTFTVSGTADRPLHLMFLTLADAPAAAGARVHIDVAEGASLQFIESHRGIGAYLANPALTIQLGKGARMDRAKLELEGAEATHLAVAELTLAADAVLRDFTLTSGAALNRQNGRITFAGEGADARVTGAYLLGGAQHADTRLVVDHQVPRCLSREVFKCVMDGDARGVFQGKVIVAPDAQKTDGKQSSHALLLSERAEFDAKPELEIYADDVVCGHGATSGDLDHDHMFYLMSRGIPQAEAKAMLIAAFVGEVFDGVDHEGLRDVLTAFAQNWLTAHKS
jgi:Fe-S cluster assembly protein SufD